MVTNDDETMGQSPMDESTGVPPTDKAKSMQRNGIRWTAVIVAAVLVIAAGFAGWSWYSSAHKSAETPLPTSPGPLIMTKDQLVVVATTTGHSVYWAGARGLDTYEVTIVNRDVYVRYLPAGVAAGSSTPYLTVGTYEKTDAYAGLVSAASVSGAKSEKLSGGALVVVPAGKPTSAYFAFQGANLLMEVYDPVPGAALKLVTSGAVQPIQ